MKKLTAGIFATILGLTAIDAYAAQVASTNYVQGAIDSLATVAKTGAYGDLTGTPSIPSIEGLATETYVDQAESDAVATAKAYTDAEIGEIGDMTVKAYVDNAQATATYDDTALKARVTTAEGKITTIEGQQTTQDTAIAKAQADATQALADVAAENEVNVAQQQVIDALGVTYVKVTDVVDTYVAPTAL